MDTPAPRILPPTTPEEARTVWRQARAWAADHPDDPAAQTRIARAMDLAAPLLLTGGGCG
jgi:hypothetical protein